MLIDTHAHLWWDSYKDDLDEVLSRAKVLGVEKMIVPGTNAKSSRKAVELARKYEGVIHAGVGIHPEEILISSGNYKLQITKIKRLVEEKRKEIVAIGEIGTDASSVELLTCMDGQKELFKIQCELAIEYELPVIIHTRNSLTEALEVLDAMPQMPRGQFHCFSHDEEGVREVLSRGFYISFCGNITWSKKLKQLVRMVPQDRLLLETDSPFMMPRNDKGESIVSSLRNEPQNVRMLALLQAEMRGETVEAVEKATSENTKRVYKI